MVSWRAEILLLIIVVSLPAAAPGAEANDWPEFRGPTGQGVAAQANPPLKWSPTQNVAWRTALPGEGWSSPIVHQGAVYVTAAILNERKHPTSLRVLRFDAADGKQVWSREAIAREGPSVKNPKNTHATPTPIAEANCIYAHFGHMGTACLNLDGEVLWRQTALTYKPMHGNGGSPIIRGDKLIFSCDGESEPFVVALDKRTGEPVWKTDRGPTSIPAKFSFSTPLALAGQGRRTVVSPGSGAVFAYDPDSGDEIWRVDYREGYSVVPRPVFGHGLIFISSGFMAANIYAIRPGGEGNVTATHVAWKIAHDAPHTSSMLLAGDELYFASDTAMVSCVDARTGKLHWRQRVGREVAASPIFAGGRIYVTTERGKTVVFKAGVHMEKLAENDLAERTFASLAAAGKALFIRTESALYRIEERPPPTAP